MLIHGSIQIVLGNVILVYQIQEMWPKNLHHAHFPTWFKEQEIYPAYEDHIAWLDPQDSLRRATTGYQSLISLMKATDASMYWPRFVEECAKLDAVRGEDFWATFPEFDKLK